TKLGLPWLVRSSSSRVNAAATACADRRMLRRPLRRRVSMSAGTSRRPGVFPPSLVTLAARQGGAVAGRKCRGTAGGGTIRSPTTLIVPGGRSVSMRVGLHVDDAAVPFQHGVMKLRHLFFKRLQINVL